jgi:hypothetical protein
MTGHRLQRFKFKIIMNSCGVYFVGLSTKIKIDIKAVITPKKWTNPKLDSSLSKISKSAEAYPKSA